jgi:hypothetical protein
MLSSLKPLIELRQSQVDSAIDPSGPPTPTFSLGPLLHTPAEKKIFRDFRKCNPSGRCERERRALSHPDFFFSLAGGIAIFFFPLAFPFRLPFSKTILVFLFILSKSIPQSIQINN